MVLTRRKEDFSFETWGKKSGVGVGQIHGSVDVGDESRWPTFVR